MKKNILILIGIVFIVGVVSVGMVSFQKKPTPKKNAINANDSIIQNVSRLYDIPKNETPTIATVSDKSKLQKQAFFEKAENGDVVLIYAEAKKAALYRPSLNKIMEVTTLAIQSPPITPSAAPRRFSVSIFNGTPTKGRAALTEEKLVAAFPSSTVVEKKDAVGNYTKTQIIDISGNNSGEVKQLATLFSAQITTLPPVEHIPEGDILIIVGE